MQKNIVKPLVDGYFDQKCIICYSYFYQALIRGFYAVQTHYDFWESW